jgi:DNA-binding NarL/FixJ family response regulator
MQASAKILPFKPSGVSTPADEAAHSRLDSHALAAMLNSVDYGLAVVGARSHVVLHLNTEAETALQAHTALLALRRYGSQRALIALHSPDHALLAHAFAAAANGHTQLIRFGTSATAGSNRWAAQSLCIAVSPLSMTEVHSDEPLLLLSFEKGANHGDVALAHFCKMHQLTPAEQQVLRALTEGECPKRIAQRTAVAESTVRSHIRSIRQKTQYPSIRELVLEIARLPAMPTALPAPS